MGIRLCYWCRDHVPFEKANHLVKDCPFFQQEKLDFWTSQLGYQSTTSEVKQSSPETENSTTQENWKGILLEGGCGIPETKPSNNLDPEEPKTLTGNMYLNDEDWYQELRERFKAVVGMKTQ